MVVLVTAAVPAVLVVVVRHVLEAAECRPPGNDRRGRRRRGRRGQLVYRRQAVHAVVGHLEQYGRRVLQAVQRVVGVVPLRAQHVHHGQLRADTHTHTHMRIGNFCIFLSDHTGRVQWRMQDAISGGGVLCVLTPPPLNMPLATKDDVEICPTPYGEPYWFRLCNVQNDIEMLLISSRIFSFRWRRTRISNH